jgi:hypothetical protein
LGDCATLTEAPLAPLEARDGGEEIVLREVGPEPVEERELGVGRPVEQEVRQAKLSAGADDEVGIPDAQAREARAQHRGVDIHGVEPPRDGLRGELARGRGDLLPAAVGEGEREGHLLVLRRDAAQGVEHLAHGLGQAREVADGHEADVVVEDLVALGDQELPEQPHQRLDLARGARPVLLAERVERQRLDAEAATDPHDAADGGAAGLVPRLPRLPARLGPAAVAVHDDADVSG